MALDHAIVIQSLGKRYRLAHSRDRYGRLTESLWRLIRNPLEMFRQGDASEDFWALRDVSFEVGRGEVVGIIGRNGAGKSTLLRVLSRITEPTEGRAVLYGRVGSLLDVGTGFHPELTGRENVYLSGAVLGMRRAEIARKFDEIVDFAEVDRFLDTPVKRYSSGMQVRLGFAVAAHLEPEILVVDEVLAVGDAAFQRKCLAKMEDVSRQGRTILFVSHNLAAVENLCSSGVLLERGRVVANGSVREVIDSYLGSIDRVTSTDLKERLDRKGDGRLRLMGIETNLRTGLESEIRLAYRATTALRNLEVLIGVYTSRGEGAAWLSTELVGNDLTLPSGVGTIVCRLQPCGLLPGRYTVNVYCAAAGVVADYVADAAVIDVAEGDFFGTGRLPPPGHGSVAVMHAWAVEPG